MVEVLGRGQVRGVLRQPHLSAPAGAAWAADLWLERRAGYAFFAQYDLKVGGVLAVHAGVRFTRSQVPKGSDLFGHAMREVIKQIHRWRADRTSARAYRVTESYWLADGADAEPARAAPDR